ncbi:MAG: outer membrane beta-barrel protein [Flavobacteriaceae bacterium]|nr:outer membrane beta-barrel protein [Flavobacteriaceae bacterium]
MNYLFSTAKLLFLSLFLLLSSQLFSQKITGIVLDEENKPLEFASVALLQTKDSLLVKYTSTGPKGEYELSGFKPGEYLFQVYLMTFQADQRVLKVSKTPQNISTIILKREVNALEEVVITAVIPIKIKQDTVSFNTKAFKIKLGDNVSDLLRKLPGIEIDKDGSVKAEGDNIKKILVDGKEFFNNDPTIALQNLNADAIKSVEIIDEESDGTRTTGIKDGEKVKVINLVLKDDKKTGYFGKLGAGIGTEDRYSTKFDINRFSSKTQLALFGNLNNINNSGATVFTRDGSRSAGGGFLTTGTAGANYNYEFKKNQNFNIDYHYGYSDKEQETVSNRTEFRNDDSFTRNSASDSQNISKNHNVNFSFRDRSKKGTYIEFRGDFKKDDRTSDTRNNTVFFDDDQVKDATSERTTYSEDDRSSGKLKASIQKKINEKGRNFSVKMGLSFKDNKDVNYQTSTDASDLASLGEVVEVLEVSTRRDAIKSLNYDAALKFTEPIFKNNYLFVATKFTRNTSDQDLNQEKRRDGLVQDPLIYGLDYTKNKWSNSIGYRYSNKKVQVTLTGDYQQNEQKIELDQLQVVTKKYTDILPKITANYEFKKGKKLRLRYTKSVSLPSVNQLSPVINDFNPRFIRTGNSALTAQDVDNYSVMFYNHNYASANSLFSMITYRKTDNAIITSKVTDADYVKHVTYMNYGDKTSLSGRLYLRRKFKGIPVRYTAKLVGSVNDFTTVLEGDYSKTTSKTTEVGFTFSNDSKNNYDVLIGADLAINNTHYSLKNYDRRYIKQNYFTKVDVDITEKLTVNSQFSYTLYSDDDFISQTAPIWNMAVEYAFLKGQRGLLKFQVFDILDKDLGISRTSSDTYIEESFSTNLGTYAMLSFTYSLKSYKGKKSKRDSGRRRHYRRAH